MWQRTLAVSLLALSFGCTTIQPVEAPVPFLAMNRPSAVLIVGPDGEEFELGTPKLQSDSLFGIFEGEPFKMPLISIQQMKAKQVDNKRTALFAAAVAVGAAGVAWGIANAADKYNVPLDTSHKCPNQLCPTPSPRRSPRYVGFKIPFLIPIR